MKKKLSRHPVFWVITSILFLIIVFIAVLVFNFLPKHQYVSDSNFDLTTLTNGTYQGECDNGLVFVRVEVEVRNHAIANVRILEHRNGRGEAANSIIDSVINKQSIEVDTIAGATSSSQTILKAIENALSR